MPLSEKILKNIQKQADEATLEETREMVYRTPEYAKEISKYYGNEPNKPNKPGRPNRPATKKHLFSKEQTI
jgi:hypothetical protein